MNLLEAALTIGVLIFFMWLGWHKANFFLRMSGLSSLERRFERILETYLREKRNSTKALVCFLGLYAAASMIYRSTILNPRLAEIIFDGSYVALSFVLLLLIIATGCLAATILFSVIESAQWVRAVVKRGW